MKGLSARLAAGEPSATIAVADKARRLKAAGRDVISLASGDPDFATPSHIVDAAVAAMRAGDTHYPPSRGRPDLIDAVVAKLDRENGITARPNQVIVTPGAKWALYLALAAVIDPGDEVVILEPAWVSYAPIIGLLGGVAVTLSLPAEDGYRLSESALRGVVGERTKALIVNSPSNPTGHVLDAAEIDGLARVAVEADLYVVSDEIYEHLVFDGHRADSPATRPGMAERTLIVNGFSKAYAMTGWRLGWLAAPEPIATLAMNLHGQAVTSASSFAMAGGTAALSGSQDCVAEMVEAYAERRRIIVPGLDAIPGISCDAPDGAFYLFPRFSEAWGATSAEIADRLLEGAEIAAVPGDAFGSAGASHLRFTIATAFADLERAVERLDRLSRTL